MADTTLHRILVINPGSTSTKMAIFEDERLVQSHLIRYDAATLARAGGIWGQYALRMKPVREWLRTQTTTLSAVASMGGLIRPVPGGTYRVNERMLADARANLQGEHAANLGCAMADELAREFGCPAYVVDPVSVDELEPPARYSGHPLISRRSLSHALNIHAVARRAAGDLGLALSNSRFIVAHLGGGISVAPVKGGRIIDMNDGSSDGPFTPERTGGLPLQQFISLCYAPSATEQEMRSLVMGRGGLLAYLGTTSAQVVEERIREGDAQAREVYEAMAYQIAKEIGAMATVLQGKVDAVVLTGGLAQSELLTGWIRERVVFIAPVVIHPGEDELETLASRTLEVLRGTRDPLEY